MLVCVCSSEVLIGDSEMEVIVCDVPRFLIIEITGRNFAYYKFV